MTDLLSRLRAGEVLVADGAMGTMLFDRGLPPGECPESLNLAAPVRLEQVARLYVDAGADLVQTNTFGGSPLALARYDLDGQTDAINAAAVAAVRRVVGTRAYVSGSCGPSRRTLLPYGDTAPEEVYASFERQVRALIEAGVDVLCIETMTDLREAQLAVRAARAVSATIPVMATMTFDATPRGFFTIMGTDIRTAAAGPPAGANIVRVELRQRQRAHGGRRARVPRAHGSASPHPGERRPAAGGWRSRGVRRDACVYGPARAGAHRPGGVHLGRLLRHDTGAYSSLSHGRLPTPNSRKPWRLTPRPDGVCEGHAMTSRQRMAIAMRCGTPDRVPVMCQLSLGHYFLQASGDAIAIWHDTTAFADALVSLRDRYRFDGILVNLPGRDPRWRSYVVEVRETTNGHAVVWANGWITLVPLDDNPHVCLSDAAPTPLPRFADIDPDLLYYVEPHDLSGVTYPYSWGLDLTPAAIPDASGAHGVASPAFFPPFHGDGLSLVRSRCPDAGEVFSPFSQLVELA